MTKQTNKQMKICRHNEANLNIILFALDLN